MVPKLILQSTIWRLHETMHAYFFCKLSAIILQVVVPSGISTYIQQVYMAVPEKRVGYVYLSVVLHEEMSARLCVSSQGC